MESHYISIWRKNFINLSRVYLNLEDLKSIRRRLKEEFNIIRLHLGEENKKGISAITASFEILKELKSYEDAVEAS